MANPNQFHPKHPRCPECGKAMYKRMPWHPATKKSDPWVYCRFNGCSLFGQNQETGEMADDPGTPKAEKGKKAKPEKKAVKPEKTKKGKPEKKAVKPEKTKKGKSKLPPMEEADEAEEAETEEAEAEEETEGDDADKYGKVKKDILSGKYTASEIARRNKVSRNTISRILKKMKADGAL